LTEHCHSAHANCEGVTLFAPKKVVPNVVILSSHHCLLALLSFSRTALNISHLVWFSTYSTGMLQSVVVVCFLTNGTSMVPAKGAFTMMWSFSSFPSGKRCEVYVGCVLWVIETS